MPDGVCSPARATQGPKFESFAQRPKSWLKNIHHARDVSGCLRMSIADYAPLAFVF